MTTITLPPDLEGRLADDARRRGTTPELLALDGLRQLFAPPPADNGKRPDVWAPVDAIYGRLAGSGRTFTDSADLLREDRDR